MTEDTTIHPTTPDPTTPDPTTPDPTTPDDPDPTPPGAPVAPPRRLRRVAGTPLGGVAAGTARYVDLDTGLVRVAFVIGTLLGGFGLFVYLAGWVLLRTDDDPDPRPFVINGGLVPIVVGAVAATIALSIALGGDGFASGLIVPAILVGVGYHLLDQRDLVEPARTPAPPPPPAGAVPAPPPWGSVHVDPDPGSVPPTPRPPVTAVTIAVAAATIGGLVSLDRFTSVEVTTTAVFAAVTAVIGAGLVASAFVGRAWGLYPLALLASGGLLVAATADDWDPGNWEAGSRLHAPTSPGEVLPRYELGVGEFVLDLRRAAIDDDTDIEIDVGAGSVLVYVPDDLVLELDAHTDLGEVIPPEGDAPSGAGTSVRQRYGSSETAPVLDLEIDVALGEIEVIRD